MQEVRIQVEGERVKRKSLKKMRQDFDSLLNEKKGLRKKIVLEYVMENYHSSWDLLKAERDDLKEKLRAKFLRGVIDNKHWHLSTTTCRVPGKESIKFELTPIEEE